MLTDTDLAGMRSTAAQALPGTAVIQSLTKTSDGGGDHTTGWTAAGTVDCRLAPEMQSEGVESDRLSTDQRFVVTLPFDASVTVGSRLLIDGATYNVSGIDDRSWNVTTRVHAVKEV